MNQHKAQSHYSSKPRQSDMTTSPTTLLSSSEQINYKNIASIFPQGQSQQDKNLITLNIIQSIASDANIPSVEALLR